VGSPEVVIRPAVPADAEMIARQRRLMFAEMGRGAAAQLEAMEGRSVPFLRATIADGSYRGWLVEADGRVVAGGGMVIVPFPPGPLDPNPRRAWILNMYTDLEYRRRGLARRLMELMIEWCRKEGFASVSLHASDAGRPLYELLGFVPTNEMRLTLPGDVPGEGR
jgi:GNAT superfamily N-acetyltransferase